MSTPLNIPLNSPKRQRILYITPQPFFVLRGSPMRVRSTVTALVELGFDVDLLAYPFGEDLDLPGVRIFRSRSIPGVKSIPIGPSFRKIALDLALFVKTFQLGLKNRYCAVHGVEEAAFIAGLLAKVRGIPYVFDMHSWVSEHLAHSGFIKSGIAMSLIRKLERRCIQRAGGIVTVGDHITSMAGQVAPLVPGCSLLDLPLDSIGNWKPEDVSRLQGEFQLLGKKVIVYTGNLAGYQGIDLLLRGMQSLILRPGGVETGIESDSVRVLLVGAGGGSGGEEAEYRALTARLGIQSNVIFTGHRPETEMGAILALGDVLVSPRSEGTNPPLKVYSYMAAEKPIVATRITSHTQILDDTCAYLTELTPESFASGLFAALDASDVGTRRRASIVRAAKHLVETKYSRAEFLRRLGKLYAQVTGEVEPQVALGAEAV